MTELKPCPFCGGEVKVSLCHDFGVDDYTIGCVEACPASADIVIFNNKQEAIKAWNTRASEEHPLGDIIWESGVTDEEKKVALDAIKRFDGAKLNDVETCRVLAMDIFYNKETIRKLLT